MREFDKVTLMHRISSFVLGLIAALLLLIGFGAMPGCAEFDAARAGVARHGANAADTAFDVAKWEICTAATIGALKRELGADSKRIAGWVLFCDGKQSDINLLAPSPMLPEPQATPQSGRPLVDGFTRSL